MSDQKAIFIGESKKSEVSGDGGIGITWEMRPQSLVIGFHDDLVDRLLHDGILDEGGDGKNQDDAYEYASETAPHHHCILSPPFDTFFN